MELVFSAANFILRQEPVSYSINISLQSFAVCVGFVFEEAQMERSSASGSKSSHFTLVAEGSCLVEHLNELGIFQIVPSSTVRLLSLR